MPPSISRRNFVSSLALLPLAGACAVPGAMKHPRHYTPSGLPLRRVNVSEDRVIRTVTGLRPFRSSGFVVRAEKLGDKTVIHNYGHGGGGVTLSWGTSHLAMELAHQTGHRSCAVIGCGAVGLASARIMQREGFEVTIYARDLPPDTTSNIAGAQWTPASVFDRESVSEQFYGQLRLAMEHAYRYFQGLVGNRYGVRWISNYMLGDRPFATDDLFSRHADMYPEFRSLSREQHPFPAPYARHFDTMFIEPPVYLRAVMEDYYVAGGEIVVQTFADRRDLMSLEQPLIINCSGLGSRDLFGDEALIPVKGQLSVLMPQAGIDYLMIHDGIYMFPRKDGILLGGTFERNIWTAAPNPDESARILREHQAFFSSMEDPWARPQGRNTRI
ncbi:MAG TPA: FAD-dependent oxidoreductase [Woeseiaceae bacterium]|nr:FAD-dependent oxidoreductase [Woeseiaceae bacterium]